VKSKHFLIIGGALLAAGLVIAGLSAFTVTKEFLKDSVPINETPLEPGLSYANTLKDLPADRQLLLTLQSNPPDVPLQAKLTAPDGATLAIYNITNTPFTSAASTRSAGDHTFEIKNVGTSTVTISGAIINSPLTQQGGGVNIEDDPVLQSYLPYGAALLVGTLLVIAGIVLLIIGAIKHFRSRRSPESVSR
jgi:hypothetical protein